MIKSYSFLVIATLFIFDLTLVLPEILSAAACTQHHHHPPNPPSPSRENQGRHANPAYQYKNDQKMTSNALQGQTKKVGDVRESPFLSSLLFFFHPCLTLLCTCKLENDFKYWVIAP